MDGVLARYLRGTATPNTQCVSTSIVNFTVSCPDDISSGPHCLSLDNYHIDSDNDSPLHTWLVLESSFNPEPPSTQQLKREVPLTNSSLLPTGLAP